MRQGVLPITAIDVHVKNMTRGTNVFISSDGKQAVVPFGASNQGIVKAVDHTTDFLTIPGSETFNWFVLLSASNRTTHESSTGITWYAPLTKGLVTFTAGLHFGDGTSPIFGVVYAHDVSMPPAASR